MVGGVGAGTGSHDYETQEDWDEESQTLSSEPYPYSYPSTNEGGSSEEEEEDEEPVYEPVSPLVMEAIVLMKECSIGKELMSYYNSCHCEVSVFSPVLF